MISQVIIFWITQSYRLNNMVKFIIRIFSYNQFVLKPRHSHILLKMWDGFKSEHKKKKSYEQIRKTSKSEEKAKKVQSIVFMVADDETMGMYLPYTLSSDQIKGLIKQNGGSWCHTFKIWKIPKKSYTLVRTQIPRMIKDVKIQDLPLFIDRALRPFPQKLYISSKSQNLVYDARDRHMTIQDNFLFPKLYDFQKVTLRLAVKNFGRLIIADEMGVGKSIQGLACALLYEKEWPLLIICPSALKSVWKDEIKKWMRQKIKEGEVCVIEKNGQQFDLKIHKIVIFSYEISIKYIQSLENFNVVIVDEAHYLKNINAKRTQMLVPYLTSRKRVFLLSGTPALSKPRQTFTLIQIIRPDIFYNLKEFGDRYCYLSRNRWNHKIEYDGCRNTAQLHFLLKDRIMIRRKKDQVLHQLPQKQRQFILLSETSKIHVKQIKQLMSSKQIPLQILRNSQKLLNQLPTSFSTPSKSEGLSPLPRCYYLTGLSKLQPVINYLTALLENSQAKVLIFAHHKDVIDCICDHLLKIKVEFMRIDGNTSMQARRKNVQNFQDSFAVKAAVLSITAAGVGITLTAASTVIFAELHWTPALLLQAQDRAHRIGQRSSVNVHYLIGQNTLDNLMLRQLEKKIQTTGILLNGQKQVFQAQTANKDQLGRWQAADNDLTNRKRYPQKNILEMISIKRLNPKQSNFQPKQSESQDIDEDDCIDQQELEKMIREKELQFEHKQKTRSKGQKICLTEPKKK